MREGSITPDNLNFFKKKVEGRDRGSISAMWKRQDSKYVRIKKKYRTILQCLSTIRTTL